MKGYQLIKLIQEKQLEDFDFRFCVTEETDSFPNIKTFSVNGVQDISYSGKVVDLEGETAN